MSGTYGKAARQRLNLAPVPRESGSVDRLLDNSRQVLRLDLIDDNPRNVRGRLGPDDEDLRALAASIAAHGLLQAPVVRRSPADPDRGVVVLGQRRVAAHRLLGREEIEVIVRRFDDRQAFVASCVENVQRVQLSPREEMDMVGVLIDELGSQEAAAREVGRSKTWVTKRVRVLSLPALAAAVERGELSLDHAYDLLTRARDEDGVLADLARVRAGQQTQRATRARGAPIDAVDVERDRSDDVAPVSGRNLSGDATRPTTNPPGQRDADGPPPQQQPVATETTTSSGSPVSGRNLSGDATAAPVVGAVYTPAPKPGPSATVAAPVAQPPTAMRQVAIAAASADTNMVALDEDVDVAVAPRQGVVSLRLLSSSESDIAAAAKALAEAFGDRLEIARGDPGRKGTYLIYATLRVLAP